MKIFLIAVLLAFGSISADDDARAAQAVAKEAPLQTEFDTADAVAVAVMTDIYKNHPHYYEYGGVIQKLPSGKFTASEPTSDYHADNVDIDMDPFSYDGNWPIVADFHVHPCMKGYASGEFSPEDLHGMREIKIPGYILDECTGDVHIWDPLIDSSQFASIVLHMKGTPRGPQLSAGRIVGNIKVDGKEIVL
jgi:hypothetical protein